MHNAGMHASRTFVYVPLNGRHRSPRLYRAREHVSWIGQQWTSVLFTDKSRFSLQSDSGRVLVWREQGTRYNQPNIVKKHSFGGGRIMVWAGISLSGHTDLHA